MIILSKIIFTGCQRADGAFGALIIRVPSSADPHNKLYDRDLTEHIIQILDWDHKLGVDKFLAHHHANGNNKPKTLLVNGRGRFHQFENADGVPTNSTYSPTAKFTVQQVMFDLISLDSKLLESQILYIFNQLKSIIL